MKFVVQVVIAVQIGMILGDLDNENMVKERQAVLAPISADKTYLGCFKDDAQRHFKQLKRLYTQATLEACRQYCTGYKYVGLQASDWCACGNTLYGAEYPLVDDAECNRACAGEPTRMCGGAWRNSIYLNDPQDDTGYIGCFKDDASGHFSITKLMMHQTSLSSCRQYCVGHKYLGLQAKGWCLCGDTLYKPGYPLVPESECDLYCMGEPNRVCGSHWRNSIYHV